MSVTLAVTFLAVTAIVYYLLHLESFNLFPNTHSDATTTGYTDLSKESDYITGDYGGGNGGINNNNGPTTSTTTTASTPKTTTKHPGYDITYELFILMEDVVFERYTPTIDDCNYRKILCDLERLNNGYNPTTEDCQQHPRLCKYVELMKDKHKEDKEYSILPYGARFVLIPEDCHIRRFIKDICQMRGYKDGTETDPASTVLPTKRAQIRAMTDKEQTNYHVIVFGNNLNDPILINAKASYKNLRSSFHDLYYRFISVSNEKQYNYNHICCIRLDLEDCYENDDLTRFCYYKRFYEIYKNKMNGWNTFGLADPQSPMNVYWDKGINPKFAKGTKMEPYAGEFLIKRDCIESAASEVRDMCRYQGIPIRKTNYITAEGIKNEGI